MFHRGHRRRRHDDDDDDGGRRTNDVIVQAAHGRRLVADLPDHTIGNIPKHVTGRREFLYEPFVDGGWRDVNISYRRSLPSRILVIRLEFFYSFSILFILTHR